MGSVSQDESIRPGSGPRRRVPHTKGTTTVLVLSGRWQPPCDETWGTADSGRKSRAFVPSPRPWQSRLGAVGSLLPPVARQPSPRRFRRASARRQPTGILGAPRWMESNRPCPECNPGALTPGSRPDAAVGRPFQGTGDFGSTDPLPSITAADPCRSIPPPPLSPRHDDRSPEPPGEYRG